MIYNYETIILTINIILAIFITLLAFVCIILYIAAKQTEERTDQREKKLEYVINEHLDLTPDQQDSVMSYVYDEQARYEATIKKDIRKRKLRKLIGKRIRRNK